MIPVAKPRRARRSRRKTVRLGRRRRPAEMKGSANTSRWRSPARFVFVLASIPAVGVLCTPTNRTPAPFASVPSFLLSNRFLR